MTRMGGFSGFILTCSKGLGRLLSPRGFVGVMNWFEVDVGFDTFVAVNAVKPANMFGVEAVELVVVEMLEDPPVDRLFDDM